jgi:hypothetical protein
VLWDSIFPGQEKRDLEVIGRAYGKILEQLSVEQLDRACTKALERCRFFPLPSELLELAGEPAMQSIELEAHKAWQSFLEDVEHWATSRNAAGEPLAAEPKIIARRAPDDDCPDCAGMGWVKVDPSEPARGVVRCRCTNPGPESVPELTPATLYALRQLGGYAVVAEQIHGERAAWLQKEFIAAHIYFSRTSGLEHLPVGKSDAALLAEIEDKTGIRLLKR